MSTWLNQFWQFAFKTARYWGPQVWSADNLGFLDDVMMSSAPSPGCTDHSFIEIERESPRPTQLCRWASHVTSNGYYDTDDEDEDEEWLAYWTGASFVDTLCRNLALVKLSDIDFSQFPLAIPHIAAAASKSPDALLLEAVGFAVVSRNEGLLCRLLKRVEEQ